MQGKKDKVNKQFIVYLYFLVLFFILICVDTPQHNTWTNNGSGHSVLGRVVTLVCTVADIGEIFYRPMFHLGLGYVGISNLVYWMSNYNISASNDHQLNFQTRAFDV